MNSDEICLHSLISNNLKYTQHDIRPFALFSNNEINIINRSFETFRKWNINEQTSYIESIFLRCYVQPIVRFIGSDHTTIIDGYQRYNAITNFCNNKLILNEKGLKQLKFLAGKTFETLSDDEKNYFKNCEPINLIDYKYENSNKQLNCEEEQEIERYLHILYNTGLKLEKEEFQKAQFSKDPITNKIREKINNDENFLHILESLKQFNGRTKKNKIDNILLNCRLLIASTYSNIYNYSNTKNIQIRIDENYYPNINNLDKNNIFQDFDLNIFLIYKRLINTQKWEKYTILHTKPFIDATYWLISIIRKDKIDTPEKFEFMDYLEFFAQKEETEKNFESYQSHYQKNIYNKYFIVAKYYEQISGHNLSKYFIENEPKKTFGTINSLEELNKNHFSYRPHKTKISSLLEEVKNNNYNIRPYYQREECMNITLASRIIESILLDIAIPYILLYNNYDKVKQVTEVVDGQQRLLSILAYFNEGFYNENNEIEYSNKTNFALKDLRILYNLNKCKIKSSNPKIQLPKDKQNKIKDYELLLVNIDDNNNKIFDSVEHFIRLNKNASTIKENTYRMWSLIGDIKIINYEKNITNKYINSILPPINQKRSANMVTFKLAALFYQKNTSKELKQNDYSNNKVTNILEEFNKIKEEYMFKNPEKIKIIRNNLFKILDEVNNFYEKLELFLNKQNKSIRDLLETKKYANISLINYYYLFIMLNEISKENLLYNSDNIYKLINDFFNELKNTKLSPAENNKLALYYQEKIIIYNK